MKTVNVIKESLLSEILAEKTAKLENNKQIGGTHCSRCGHCTSTL